MNLLRALGPVPGLALLLLGCAGGLGGPRSTAATTESPRLVAIVVIDQLRADMLERYDSLFTGGLRRLLDEGHVFANATHDHAETSTAPGHTTLATGVFPSRHGIVANNWSELREGEWGNMYCVADPAAPILGFPQMSGRSPANMYRDGLADWLVDASPDARILSVSAKDRAAIGLATRAEGHVYWLLPAVGEFITSAHYRSEYPDWVRRFNVEEMPRFFSDTVWENATPREFWGLTRPDTSAYELDGEHSFFPHRAAEVVDVADPAALNEWRYEETPFPDQAVLAFAETAIRELQLGQREVVDFVGVGLSQTDLVGHRFGPFSREQLDNLLRLDQGLGAFLEALDEMVGQGRWVLGFSADHGILEIPEHLAERGVPAERLARAESVALREAVLAAVDTTLDAAALSRAVREAVSDLDFVAGAYTLAEIAGVVAPPDSFATLFGRSYSRGRALDLPARYGVYPRLPENTLSGGSGSSHGTPYYYDRHVPLILVGAGVPAGGSPTRVSTTDMAPSLARLAGIEYPDDLDGRALLGSP